jgi:hypothetical protein
VVENPQGNLFSPIFRLETGLSNQRGLPQCNLISVARSLDKNKVYNVVGGAEEKTIGNGVIKLIC